MPGYLAIRIVFVLAVKINPNSKINYLNVKSLVTPAVPAKNLTAKKTIANVFRLENLVVQTVVVLIAKMNSAAKTLIKKFILTD